ncbi:MAG TPA: hypothetical protein LFV66_02205, partial [Rickettsia endosymbiont of Bembidion lapponicum]|nr:hypothetical protein [Rickettsia endosymbiont of Bembidion lapponicum]
MKKKLYIGTDHNSLSVNDNVEMIQDIRNIQEQQANEWFIGAHGGEFFPAVNQEKFLNKMKSFFRIHNEKKVKSDLMFKGAAGENESMQIVLWRILLATFSKSPEAVNIIHVHACHSGAAQNYLKSVPGNFVLCTYSKENKSTITEFSKILYENRFKTTNLIDFISDNFHLLASVNFKISYKFDKKISSFSLDSDKITNITDSEKLKLFLNKEYNK